jgi:hypothetical protein
VLNASLCDLEVDVFGLDVLVLDVPAREDSDANEEREPSRESARFDSSAGVPVRG